MDFKHAWSDGRVDNQSENKRGHNMKYDKLDSNRNQASMDFQAPRKSEAMMPDAEDTAALLLQFRERFGVELGDRTFAAIFKAQLMHDWIEQRHGDKGDDPMCQQITMLSLRKIFRRAAELEATKH